MTKPETRNLIFGEINAVVANFLYYDRKHDEELTYQMLSDALENGDVTVEEIVEAFRQEMLDALK